MIAVVLAGFDRHTDTAVWLKRPLKGLICLKSYNCFFFFIEISRSMGCNGGDNMSIHIQDTAFFMLFLCQLHNLCP